MKVVQQKLCQDAKDILHWPLREISIPKVKIAVGETLFGKMPFKHAVSLCGASLTLQRNQTSKMLLKFTFKQIKTYLPVKFFYSLI